MSCWPNGKASDYESEDSGFDSQAGFAYCICPVGPTVRRLTTEQLFCLLLAIFSFDTQPILESRSRSPYVSESVKRTAEIWEGSGLESRVHIRFPVGPTAKRLTAEVCQIHLHTLTLLWSAVNRLRLISWRQQHSKVDLKTKHFVNLS